MVGKLDIHMQKKKSRPLPHTFKSQLKIDSLTGWSETIKTLEENRTKGVSDEHDKDSQREKLTSYLIILQELTPSKKKKNHRKKVLLTNQTVSN